SVTRYIQNASVDEPVAESRAGATSYYEQDGLSSITSLSNSSGVLANTYAYDAFGNLTASTGTLLNPFQYTGRDYDAETGLRYYRARYYDPKLGRFINEDEIGNDEGASLYLYVGNAPTSFTDPTGFSKLKGFPPDEAGLMDAAIREAIAKLKKNCPSCAGPDGLKLIKRIEKATFVYLPQFKECGETGLLTFLRLRDTLGIGPAAFRPGCCKLSSTI